MKSFALCWCCAVFLCCGAAEADRVTMPDASSDVSAPSDLPAKGQSMDQVRHHFGEPQKRYAPAGGDTPKHPPITRWDYPGFSVYFEHTHVVDAVVPGHPPPVSHAEQLSQASK